VKGVIDVAQTVNVNFKLDAEVKKNMEIICDEIGLSMSAAFTIFAKKVSRERRIPFELSADPFYSEDNISELERRVAKMRSGKDVLNEHALIEVD
jgi:DNA-damage-inducible protein J